MNRDTYCDSRGLRHQKLQQIATAVALLFAYLLAAGRTPAQTGKPSAEKQAKIETAISKFMAASKVPGISAAVVESGEFVWSAGFGMADLENFVPATSETLYRLGSISKPITSTAAMQLWERGKLDLDSSVQRYCPAFPQKQWPITTRELLGHLGGIRHYNSESQDDPESATPATSEME
jgi:CubicO group peptidase (beta-lactamase class C family)